MWTRQLQQVRTSEREGENRKRETERDREKRETRLTGRKREDEDHDERDEGQAILRSPAQRSNLAGVQDGSLLAQGRKHQPGCKNTHVKVNK